MSVVKFEPDPLNPGSGNATDENGRTVYVHDPDAAKRLNPTLADQVNQQSTAAAVATVGAPPAAPDARVASNAAGSAALGPPPDPAAPASPAAQLVAKTSQVAAGASAIPAAAAAPPAKPAGAGAALVGKLGQLPVAQTSTSTSVQKGRDAGKVETEIGSLRKADAGLDTQMRAGAESGDVRTQKAAEGEQALALGEYARNYTAEQQERQRKEQIESEITALSGEKDADTNPTRLLDDMSTGKSMGMVLLAGIAGAFGNMHGEGRNPFLDAIDKRMDQDLQNQRDQIASGRLRRNNRIAYLQSQGADAKQAQAAYEARVYGAAADWARAQIKAQSLQGAQLEQANLAIAQLEQGRAARDAQLREATESKYATTSNVVREAPKAVGSGNAVEDFTKKLAAREAYEKAGANPEQLAAFDAAVGIPAPKAQSETSLKRENEAGKQTDDEGKAASAFTGIGALGQKSGLERDPKTGGWRAPEGIKSMQAPALQETIPGWFGASTPISDAREAAIEGFGRLQSGGVISPDEAKRFGDMLGDKEMSRTQLASKMNAIETIIRPRLAAHARKAPSSAEADGFKAVP